MGEFAISADQNKSYIANPKLYILFTHSLGYIYFSQFIHHILFNVSTNQSLYQESFSFNVT